MLLFLGSLFGVADLLNPGVALTPLQEDRVGLCVVRFVGVGNRLQEWEHWAQSLPPEMPLSFFASWSSEVFHDCNNVVALRVVKRSFGSLDIDWWEERIRSSSGSLDVSNPF